MILTVHCMYTLYTYCTLVYTTAVHMEYCTLGMWYYDTLTYHLLYQVRQPKNCNVILPFHWKLCKIIFMLALFRPAFANHSQWNENTFHFHRLNIEEVTKQSISSNIFPAVPSSWIDDEVNSYKQHLAVRKQEESNYLWQIYFYLDNVVIKLSWSIYIKSNDFITISGPQAILCNSQ